MYNLSLNAIFMGPCGGASGAGSDQKWCFAFVFISLARKRICVQSAYCLKAQSSLVTMIPSNSMNPGFSETLGPLSGCLSKKSDIFAFPEQSGSRVVRRRILAQLQQAYKKSNGKSSPESIDPGTAEIQAIQFRG